MQVITELLACYGQGGSCREEPEPFMYHNTFLLCDRQEAYVLETAGQYWAAEKITGELQNIALNMALSRITGYFLEVCYFECGSSQSKAFLKKMCVGMSPV